MKNKTKITSAGKMQYMEELVNRVSETGDDAQMKLIALAISTTTEDIVRHCIAENFPYQLTSPHLDEMIKIGKESIASAIEETNKPSEILFEARVRNAVGSYLKNMYA